MGYFCERCNDFFEKEHPCKHFNWCVVADIKDLVYNLKTGEVRKGKGHMAPHGWEWITPDNLDVRNPLYVKVHANAIEFLKKEGGSGVPSEEGLLLWL